MNKLQSCHRPKLHGLSPFPSVRQQVRSMGQSGSIHLEINYFSSF
jgi:hypothetical protein